MREPGVMVSGVRPVTPLVKLACAGPTLAPSDQPTDAICPAYLMKAAGYTQGIINHPLHGALI